MSKSISLDLLTVIEHESRNKQQLYRYKKTTYEKL